MRSHTELSRRKSVRKKLNAMALEFAGKNVLIVDGAPNIHLGEGDDP